MENEDKLPLEVKVIVPPSSDAKFAAISEIAKALHELARSVRDAHDPVSVVVSNAAISNCDTGISVGRSPTEANE